jgi:hypothetical protein
MLDYEARMNLRAVAVLVLPILIGFSAEASSPAGQPESTPHPTLLDQTLTVLHLKHAPKPKSTAQVHDGMALSLRVEPTPFKLSENREIKVTVTVANESSKKYVHLNFPTSQRIEVLVQDSTGKVVNTWSEDQSFTNDPASVTVNPGERLEYTVSVATREMSAGQRYVIEASFPSYPDLKVQQLVAPAK